MMMLMPILSLPIPVIVSWLPLPWALPPLGRAPIPSEDPLPSRSLRPLPPSRRLYPARSPSPRTGQREAREQSERINSDPKFVPMPLLLLALLLSHSLGLRVALHSMPLRSMVVPLTSQPLQFRRRLPRQPLLILLSSSALVWPLRTSFRARRAAPLSCSARPASCLS